MYITLNSQFRPFTYDELVKPLQDYGEAYREVEEQYATLAQQTEAWKNIATQENSPEAYAMYKKYSDELNAVVEDFSRGMTLQNRGQLMGLKSRYSSEIGAIERASEALEEANRYREALKTQDNTVVFAKDRYTSLDDFLNGQLADNSYVSGRQLEATAASRAQAASYNKFNELQSLGISADTAAKSIVSGETNTSFIDSIIKDTMATMDLSNYDNESIQRIRDYVALGVQTGIGSFASQEYIPASQRASLNYQNSSRIAQLRAQGFDAQGRLDPNNPINTGKGYIFQKDENGNYIRDNEGNPLLDIEAMSGGDFVDVEVPGLGVLYEYNAGWGDPGDEKTTDTYNLWSYLRSDLSSPGAVAAIESNSDLRAITRDMRYASKFKVDITKDEDGDILSYRVYADDGTITIRMPKDEAAQYNNTSIEGL